MVSYSSFLFFFFVDSAKDAEKEKSKKEGLGTFYNLPHYMKMYEVLKGAYSNYRVSTGTATLFGNHACSYSSRTHMKIYTFQHLLHLIGSQLTFWA